MMLYVELGLKSFFAVKVLVTTLMQTVCTMIYLVTEGSSKQRGIAQGPAMLPLCLCFVWDV